MHLDEGAENGRIASFSAPSPFGACDEGRDCSLEVDAHLGPVAVRRKHHGRVMSDDHFPGGHHCDEASARAFFGEGLLDGGRNGGGKVAARIPHARSNVVGHNAAEEGLALPRPL